MSEFGRWWSNADGALWALSKVDDSNVAMGVGTSVLGYHGLAYVGLDELANQTLADGRAIMRTFDRLDLDPVRHAVSKAIKPIMGSEADRYADLWVEDLHNTSIESALNLYGSLTTQGMPSPLSIDRLAAVAGVPMDKLGRTYGVLREQRTSPRVLADAADRVLMEYASHRGRLENTPVAAEVGKSVAFDEGDHPRTADGRFRSKGKKVDPRAERAERRLRRMKRLVRQQQAVAQVQSEQVKERAGQGMKQALAPLRPKTEATAEQMARPVNQMVPGSPLAQALARRDAYRAYNEQIQEAGVSIEEVATPLIYDDEIADGLLNAQFAPSASAHMMDYSEGIYIPVTREEANILLDRAREGYFDFSVGGFKRLTGSDMRGYTKAQALADITQQAHTQGLHLDDVVMLRLKGLVPLVNLQHNIPDLESGEIDHVLMPDEAFLQLGTDWEYERDHDGFQYEDEAVIEVPIRANWQDDRAYDKHIPIMDLDFYSVDTGLPLTRTDAIKKAYAFREADVVRDEQGRFAPEGQKVDPDLEARQARLKRRMGRQQRLRAQVEEVNARAAQQAEKPYAALAPLRPQAEPGAAVTMGRPVNRMTPALAAQYKRAAEVIAQNQAANVEGALVGLQGVRFSPDQRGMFEAVTGVNPFGEMFDSGDMTGFVGSGRMDTARQDILNDMLDMSATGNSATLVEAVGIRAIDPIVNTESTSSTRVAGRGSELYADELTALANAQRWADARNGGLDAGEQWEVFVEAQDDGLYGTLYKPMAVKTTTAPAASFIFGDDEAMAYMNAGYDVEFEPLPYSNLRELVMETGLNTDYNPTEFPDVPIQAVRVKLRENPRMEDN